jgi:PIN domain nuclease of toxin-antitoxin system
MNFLIDTHDLIWIFSDAPNLTEQIRHTLQNPANALFVSVASIWEAEIKAALRKLPLPDEFVSLADEISAGGAIVIDAVDARAASRLPPHHRDPFDRMLVAHAQRHALTVVTHDRIFERYGVPVLWC